LANHPSFPIRFFPIFKKTSKTPVGAPALSQVRQLYSPAASDIAFGSDMRFARWKLAGE